MGMGNIGMGNGMDMSGGDQRRSTSPNENHQQYHTTHNSPTLLSNWAIPQQPQQQLHQYIQDTSVMNGHFAPFSQPYGHGHQQQQHHHQQQRHQQIDYHIPTTQDAMEASLQQLETPFNTIEQTQSSQTMQWGMGMANWQDFQNAMYYTNVDTLQNNNIGRESIESHSPNSAYLEVTSLPSSSSDHGWNTVDTTYQNFQAAFQPQMGQQQPLAISNPGQTLHLRSHSDSSNSDIAGPFPDTIFGSFEDISIPAPYSPYSQESDTYVDVSNAHRNCFHGEAHHHQHSHTHSHSSIHSHNVHEVLDTVSPASAVGPVAIKLPVTRQGGNGSSTPPARRNSAGSAKKSPSTKSTKSVISRKTSNGKKDTEKRVGRRKGPLLPEQRKQAGEIRKLRACLRCKFLKKTCDKGEPCAGCQPSHARLWQVPCTRIDIKEINYFMKDWKADYERHVGLGITVYNIKGFAEKEELMWITHGYGFAIPIMAREVYVTDDSCFMIDWAEADHQEPIEFDVRTEKMSAGSNGVSKEALHEYLDKHLDGPFEEFIDNYFEGTPFITEILKTAHRYYKKEKLPVIRKALKLVLAYNLTMHVTMVQHQGEDPEMEGKIDDEESKFFGKTFAPVMINFQIKCALADMWREFQKEVLEELSSLYSSVYSGDRLKNWPTIFMLAAILLAVWEEMQFDCHYRVADEATVEKFCNDMETTPVGVIVGLFHAISQKLPAFTEWETRKHGQLLNNNVAVCDAMTEMRGIVSKHGMYSHCTCISIPH